MAQDSKQGQLQCESKMLELAHSQQVTAAANAALDTLAHGLAGNGQDMVTALCLMVAHTIEVVGVDAGEFQKVVDGNRAVLRQAQAELAAGQKTGG